MLVTGQNRQSKMEFVVIDDLMPKEHLLRKIDKYIDFSFINEICRPYYCEDNGRPAVEPEIMFKMLFWGYLYGIRSETRLVEKVRLTSLTDVFWDILLRTKFQMQVLSGKTESDALTVPMKKIATALFSLLFTFLKLKPTSC